MTDTLTQSARHWNPRSITLIVLAWLILHIGCLFTPGLLDDVDSVYIEIAREMLLRHDFVTPTIDGIRFFDKPPLMYWLAAGSMHVFGAYDWAARLPLALLTLALLLAVYALGLRLFSDSGALYSALALATCIGPFLYTRFFIPDILICLWMTLAVHAFLIALERIGNQEQAEFATGAERARGKKNPLIATVAERESVKTNAVISTEAERESIQTNAVISTEAERSGETPAFHPYSTQQQLLPCLAFAAVTALNLLTKGFIGLVFPLGFVILYLAFTRKLRLLPKLHVISSTTLFLAIAAPWHIFAALRNPAIAMPPGLGLPARAGWAWFYLYNEHIARFVSRRIPHDYGQVPIWLFWLLAAIWLFPWTAFLPGAVAQHLRDLRQPKYLGMISERGTPPEVLAAQRAETVAASRRNRKTALALLLWAGLVLVFFTLSARQEYYSLPALPALALMVGGLLAGAEDTARSLYNPAAIRSAIRWHLWLLVPLCSLAAAIALFFAITAPRTDPNTDIATLLAQGGVYNLSLSHIFDLTGRAMGLFRAPLLFVAASMVAIVPISYLLRRRGQTYAANLTLAAASACLLLCIHTGLVRFYPTLGSKALAEAINTAQALTCNSQPATCTSQDLILIDGELTSGSTLLFYTRQPVHLVNGRINGPWFGSFWPDAPALFETDATLHHLWSSPRRLFLLTYHPETRTPDLAPFGPVRVLAASGGKSILTNR